MTPAFSVIIPVYNRGAMVRQAIDSALNQENPAHEVIVVDDGSTDDTPIHLRHYGPRIKLLTQSNLGPEIARNQGAKAASGNYLCFLDSDDFMLPWALSTYRKVLSLTPQATLILGRVLHFASGEAYAVDPTARIPIEVSVYPDILSKDRPSTYSFSVFVVEKAALAAAGGFRHGSPHMFQGDDMDFLLRMGIFGPFVSIQKPATVAYRSHAGNSLQDFSQLVEGFRINIQDERHGLFPGGKARRTDRYALIGGCLSFWLLKSIQLGHYRSALALLAMGYPMIAARLFKALKTRRNGPADLISLGKP